MPERGPARRRGFVLGICGLAAAVQVVLGARGDLRLLERVPVRWLSEVETPPNPEASAVRVLPRIAARVPRDARVLVLSSVLVRIQYEFYFLPRPFELLVEFPAAVVAAVRDHDPLFGWYASRLRDLYERRGQLWTPERCARSVAAADYVVAFGFAQPLPEAPRLELVERLEDVALYAVRR